MVHANLGAIDRKKTGCTGTFVRAAIEESLMIEEKGARTRHAESSMCPSPYVQDITPVSGHLPESYLIMI